MNHKVVLLLLLLLPIVVLADESADLAKRGDSLMQQKQYEAAFKAYSDANKKGGSKCSYCLIGMGYSKAMDGKDRDAIKFLDKAILAAATPAERADAHTTKGSVLMMFWKSDAKNPELAEKEFRAALADAPQNMILHARIGLALGRQKKDSEAIEELKVYLAAGPKAANAEQVQQWIADPRRMRATIAPDFTVKTLTGDEIKLSSLAGKIVVLDFWATWCPPCVASVDELKELRKKYPEQKLVLVSVSADHDQKAWEQFIAKKKMQWPQYFDGDGKIQTMFAVNSYPTYILIDGEGLIRERVSGMNPAQSVASRLKEQLKELIPE
jgi:peroxiredoxin